MARGFFAFWSPAVSHDHLDAVAVDSNSRPRRTPGREAGVASRLPSGQIVGVSSTISLCGSTMNFQPSLGSRNRTRVG